MMSEFETNLNRLIGQLKALIPYNEQERRDREVMLGIRNLSFSALRSVRI